MDADKRGVAAGLYRVGADLAVILFPDPAAAGDVGVPIKVFRSAATSCVSGTVGQRGLFRRRHMRTVVERRIVGKRRERDVADDLAMMFEHHAAGVGDGADDREVEFPFVEDRGGEILAAGLQHHQHAFLRFGQHHFIGRHAGFALRHIVPS